MGIQIILIILLIIAIFYTFIYFLFIRKYEDLRKLFILNKLYDIFIIIPELFIGVHSLIFFRILTFINLLSIIYIVIKNKEPKRKIIYAIVSHSEWLIFF